MECFEYAFHILTNNKQQYLLYLMEYIRESRRPPGRLKGGVWGGGPPLRKKSEKRIYDLSWGERLDLMLLGASLGQKPGLFCFFRFFTVFRTWMFGHAKTVQIQKIQVQTPKIHVQTPQIHILECIKPYIPIYGSGSGGDRLRPQRDQL